MTATQMNEMYNNAADYARRSWKVFPLAAVGTYRCGCDLGTECPTPGLHPLNKDGHHDASSSLSQVSSIWKKTPEANVGLKTGPSAGLLALVVDGKVALDSLQKLEAENGPLLRTPVAVCEDTTIYYFSWPAGADIPTTRLGDLMLEVRAKDSWVVAPPSRRPDGEAFHWKVSPNHVSLARPPQWLVEMTGANSLSCDDNLVSADETVAEPSPTGDSLNDDNDNPCTSEKGSAVPTEGNSVSTASQAVEPCLPHQWVVGDIGLRRDHDFATLLPPPTIEEIEQLEHNLLAAGKARDPILTWKNFVVDGHHRLAFCIKHHLPYYLEELDLPDLEAVLQWIIRHQLGKRNLDPATMAFYRGLIYNRTKQGRGGNRKTKGSSGQGGHSKTAERLAKAHGVSPRTIRRDGEFAEAVEKVVKSCGPEVKPQLLGKQKKLDRKQVEELAELPAAERQQAVQEAIEATSTSKKKTKNKPGITTGKQPSRRSQHHDLKPAEAVITFKLSLKPKAMAQVLLKALDNDKALALALALEKATSNLSSGQPAKPSQNAKPKNKPKEPAKGKHAPARKKGQQPKPTGRTSRKKPESDQLPVTKPRRGRLSDPMLA